MTRSAMKSLSSEDDGESDINNDSDQDENGEEESSENAFAFMQSKLSKKIAAKVGLVKPSNVSNKPPIRN